MFPISPCGCSSWSTLSRRRKHSDPLDLQELVTNDTHSVVSQNTWIFMTVFVWRCSAVFIACSLHRFITVCSWICYCVQLNFSFSLLCTVKFVNENRWSRGTGRISNLLRGLLHHFVGFAPAIFLAIFLCTINIDLTTRTECWKLVNKMFKFCLFVGFPYDVQVVSSGEAQSVVLLCSGHRHKAHETAPFPFSSPVLYCIPLQTILFTGMWYPLLVMRALGWLIGWHSAELYGGIHQQAEMRKLWVLGPSLSTGPVWTRWMHSRPISVSILCLCAEWCLTVGRVQLYLRSSLFWDVLHIIGFLLFVGLLDHWRWDW